MHLLGEPLALLAVASLGIFLGAMLTEGLVLVPYWRSLPAEAFYSWYEPRQAPSRLLRPTHVACCAIGSGCGGYLLVDDTPWRWYAVAAAACALVVVSMFFVYFERANASFSLGKMPANELRVELDRWAAWHWMRSGLSLAALTAAVLAAWQ